MSIICILGGLGYIGSHIALIFLKNNIEVLLIDNFSNSDIIVFNNLQSKYKNVIFRSCDINDKELLGNILSSYNINTVIYAFRDSFTNNTYMANYEICNKLLSIFEGIDYSNKINGNRINKLIFASNIDIYTSQKGLHLEDDEFNIVHPYSFLICLKEKMISDYYTFRKHISIIILRLTIPVGGDSIFYDMYNNKNYIINNPGLQNNLLGHYLYDTRFNIYGCKYNTIDGSNNINLLSIYDICMAFWRAHIFLDSQSRIFKTYNIANNSTLTIIQFIKLLTIYNNKNLIEKSIRFYILNVPNLKISNKTYSIEKAEKELNWRPFRSILIDMSELIYHTKKQQSNNVLYLNNDVFYPQNEYIILESGD